MYSTRLREKDGKQIPVFKISLLIILVLPIISFLIGGVKAEIDLPVLKKLSETSYTFDGGMRIPPEFMALVLSLSLYTATFVAENVRAGIQGINKGRKKQLHLLV